MIFVGIDVAKDKHDCFILNSEGTVLADVFTIANNRIGFETLLSRIQSCSQGESKIKVGLEATGHYSYNLLGFLLDSGLTTYVINPLHTNLYRKSLSLRRTKTDRIDARTIAMMLMSDVDLKSYSNTAYHNEELKSLTRYRFDKVKERAKLKSSVARLVNILFPELEKLVSSLHIAVVYALLSNYPGASYIANANTEELAETLCTASKGRYTKSKTAEIQVAAGVSIGSKMPAKSMELKHTIALIRELDKEISEVESAIDKITSQMDSPIFTIPGIGRHMGAMILAEVGDFSNFASADKLLAYAGLSPSTYQSGQLEAAEQIRKSKTVTYSVTLKPFRKDMQCGCCGARLYWHPKSNQWFCRECGMWSKPTQAEETFNSIVEKLRWLRQNLELIHPPAGKANVQSMGTTLLDREIRQALMDAEPDADALITKILHRAELEYKFCSAGDADPATLLIQKACTEYKPTEGFPETFYKEVVSKVILYRDTHIEFKLQNGQIV